MSSSNENQLKLLNRNTKEEQHLSSSDSEISDATPDDESQNNTITGSNRDHLSEEPRREEDDSESDDRAGLISPDRLHLLESKTNYRLNLNSLASNQQLINQHKSLSSLINDQAAIHHEMMNSKDQQQSINQDGSSHHQTSTTTSGHQKDFDEVKQVELFGISIVALTINGKERLCLAQISNTLLKEFSYNEIHNRRVALGITCVQCTPIQLEMLRRAGAMPSSSRRCGMITRREAERLCRSFLVEEQPPELPENFHFNVAHRVNYGCKGRFIPARYISSRAKCIECFYCGEFFSPNKFIFHSHRQPHANDCNPPDSPNINSWRKHIDLDWNLEHSQDIKYAWEDVKSLFNGGTRRRAPNWSSNPSEANEQTASQTNEQKSSRVSNMGVGEPFKNIFEDSEQLINVECDDRVAKRDDNKQGKVSTNVAGAINQAPRLWSSNNNGRNSRSGSIMATNYNQSQAQTVKSTQLKRLSSSGSSLSNFVGNTSKRQCFANNSIQDAKYSSTTSNQKHNSIVNGVRQQVPTMRTFPINQSSTLSNNNQALQFCDFLSSSSHAAINRINTNQDHSSMGAQSLLDNQEKQAGPQPSSLLNQMSYPSTNFIYNQLYSQLIQQSPQQASVMVKQQSFPIVQPQLPQQQTITGTTNNSIEAQLALRHHLWSSLIANLQCNASDQVYTATPQLSNVGTLGSGDILPELNSSNFQEHPHLNPNLPLKLQRQTQQQP